MAEYGITAAGFVKKTEAIILAEIIADAQTAEFFGSDDLQYDATNPLYRQFLLMAKQQADTWDLAEAVYYANDMLSNNGADLNRLASISIFPRLKVSTDPDVYESDPVYLARYLSTVSQEGFSVPVLQLKLTEAQGITFARVEENNFDVDDINGLTPHSVHVILEGDPDLTAEELNLLTFNVFQIWKTEGIQMKGAVEVTGIDINGIARTYLYDLPDEIDIYITYNISLAIGTDAVAWKASYEEGIKSGAISIVGGTYEGDPVIGKKPGDDIEAYELTEPVEGIINVVGEIDVNVARTVTPTTKRVEIEYFEKGQTDTAKIIVNAVALT